MKSISLSKPNSAQLIFDKKTILSFCFAIIFAGLNAQIIYTDIEDTTLYLPPLTNGYDDFTVNYYFDVNDDGSNDFRVRNHYWETYVSPSSPYYPNREVGFSCMGNNRTVFDEGCVVNYSYNTLIPAEVEYSWGYIYVEEYMLGVYCGTPWYNTYLALKLVVGGSFYYGWVEVSFTGYTPTVHAYAYNSIAGEPIYAGQTITTSLDETAELEGSVYFSKGKLQFRDPKHTYSKYFIYNMQGSCVEAKGLAGTRSINLNHLLPGLYVIVFKDEEKQLVKKIMLN